MTLSDRKYEIITGRLDHWQADEIAKRYRLDVDYVKAVLAACGHERPGRRGSPQRYALKVEVAAELGLEAPDLIFCRREGDFWLEGR